MKKNLSTLMLLTILLTITIVGMQFVPFATAGRGYGGGGGCGGGGGGSGGGFGGGTSVIDPPPGDAFKDPVTAPNLSTTPGIVNVSIEAKIAPIKIGNTWANFHI